MKLWIAVASVILVGCSTDSTPTERTDPNRNNAQSNNGSRSNNATNNSNSNNSNNNSNNSNNGSNNLNNGCEPVEVSCENQCGEFDDGCGEIVDCGRCNCEEGGATDVIPCGPCGYGVTVCGEDETGDGTCSISDLFTEDNCSEFLWVVPGSPDAGAIGTDRVPFGTISAALQHAEQFGQVGLLIAEGTIVEVDPLVFEGAKPHLVGGFTTDLVRDDTARPRIEVASLTGVSFASVTEPMWVENLEFVQSDQSQFAIGMAIESCDDNLTLRNVTVRAGAGGAGSDGVDGADGIAGAAGGDGRFGTSLDITSGPCVGNFAAALAGEATSVACADGTVLSGHNGGESQGLSVSTLACDPNEGRPGSGPNGGDGGIARLIFPARAGGDGASIADPAADGTIPPGAHPFDPRGEHGSDGTDGLHGAAGSGGGGGFNSDQLCLGAGGAGGAGGTGGCGGEAGTAGSGGYDSIALLYLDSTARIEHSTFIAGSGGDGGRGGDGGTGGSGGAGGAGGDGFCPTVTVTKGGAGGSGSAGQNGGHATGGVGGRSVGVWGTADISKESNTVTVGVAGKGGDSMVGASPDGETVEFLMYREPAP